MSTRFFLPPKSRLIFTCPLFYPGVDTVSGNWELGRKNLGIWENRQRNLGIWELGFLWELGIQVVKTGNLGIEFIWELGIID